MQPPWPATPCCQRLVLTSCAASAAATRRGVPTWQRSSWLPPASPSSGSCNGASASPRSQLIDAIRQRMTPVVPVERTVTRSSEKPEGGHGQQGHPLRSELEEVAGDLCNRRFARLPDRLPGLLLQQWWRCRRWWRRTVLSKKESPRVALPIGDATRTPWGRWV